MRPSAIGLIALPVLVGGMAITTAVIVVDSGPSASQGPPTSTTSAATETAAGAEVEEAGSGSDLGSESGSGAGLGAGVGPGVESAPGTTTDPELEGTRIDGTRPHLTVVQGGANAAALGALPVILSDLPPLPAELDTDLAPLTAVEPRVPDGPGRKDRPAEGPADGRPDLVEPAPRPAPPASRPLPDRPNSDGTADGDSLRERPGHSPFEPQQTLDGDGDRDGDHATPGLRPGPPPNVRPAPDFLEVGPRGTPDSSWLDGALPGDGQLDGVRPVEKDQGGNGADPRQAGKRPEARPGDRTPVRPSEEGTWRDVAEETPAQGAQGADVRPDDPPRMEDTPLLDQDEAPLRGGGYLETVPYPRPEVG